MPKYALKDYLTSDVFPLANGTTEKKKRLSGRRISVLRKLTGLNWPHKETWKRYGINPRPARGGWYEV